MNKTIGRNDLCPCGSGKKYKYCCMRKTSKEDAEFNYEYLNDLWGKLYKNILILEKRKENIEDDKIELPEALGYEMAINELSLIKAILENNYKNPASFLNLRNIIEDLSIILLYAENKIDEKHIKLFREQYKIIEHKLYKNYEQTDVEILNERYKEVKDEFKDVLSKKMNEIERSRFPFLSDKYNNYNEILNEVCPVLLQEYQLLSILIHPCKIYDLIDFNSINKVLKIVTEKYITIILIDKGMGRKYSEYKDFLLTQDENNCMYKFEAIIDKQRTLFYSMAKQIDAVYGNSGYLTKCMRQIIDMFYDINLDYFLGLNENVKLKVKVFFEYLAEFNEVYFPSTGSTWITNNKNNRVVLFGYHCAYKYAEIIGAKDLDEYKKISYECYKNEYPNSRIDYDAFLGKFNKNLGYLIDGEGKVESLCNLVNTYIRGLLYGLDKKEQEKGEEYLMLLYNESQKLSHGSGYLYYANVGAKKESWPVIICLDKMLEYNLKKVLIFYQMADKTNKSNQKVTKILKESKEEWHKLIEEKHKIIME